MTMQEQLVEWWYAKLWLGFLTLSGWLKRAGSTLLDAGWALGDYTANSHYPATRKGRQVTAALLAAKLAPDALASSLSRPRGAAEDWPRAAPKDYPAGRKK
jgi:hypothetical protein